ncbi:MAG TPA: glycosyltransferase, partial [Phycisphaerales bacterium]|nr:glycosyltransferase [Phycisphaerales bacterium]
ANGDAQSCRMELGLDPAVSTLLVTGASQGATSINVLMTSLARTNPQLFEHWQILHLTGSGADEEVRKAYASAGIRAVVQPFVHEVGKAWGAADLAISRAGANSVAEAVHNRVPCLFLPYPHHKDMHQLHNAKPIADAGGAIIVMDQVNPERNRASLEPALAELLSSPHSISEMRVNLERVAAPDAALHVAGLLLTSLTRMS